jgi:hypothetical protein
VIHARGIIVRGLFMLQQKKSFSWRFDPNVEDSCELADDLQPLKPITTLGSA